MIHNLNIEYSNFECVICKFSVGLYCPITRYRKLMKIHLGMDNLIILLKMINLRYRESCDLFFPTCIVHMSNQICDKYEKGTRF